MGSHRVRCDWSHLAAAAGGARGQEPACQCKRCRRHQFDPWVGKIPWKRAWQPTPVFLLGEFHGQRSLAGYSPWVTQSWTRLSTRMPDWWKSSNRRSGSKGLRKGTGPYDLKQLMATKYGWLSRTLTDHLPSPSCFWESPCSRNTRHGGAFLVHAHSISPATGWSRLTPLTELNPLNPSLLSSQI